MRPARRAGVGASAGRPSRTAIRARIPAAPTSSAGSRTVVSSGSTAVARARSSKPVTETSSGTRSPSRRAALQAPAARMSSSQISAVGRGPGPVSARVRGLQPGLDAQGGRLGAQHERRGRRGRPSASGAGAHAEGPGVHSRREVGDAAVAEGEQMAGHLPHAVGDIEVDGGARPGRRRGRCPASPAAGPRPAQRGQRVGGHGGGDHAVERGRGRSRRGRGRGRCPRGRGRGPRRSRGRRRPGRRRCRRGRRTRWSGRGRRAARCGCGPAAGCGRRGWAGSPARARRRGRLPPCAAETRPRHLSPSTSETVAWETPAAGPRPGWWRGRGRPPGARRRPLRCRGLACSSGFEAWGSVLHRGRCGLVLLTGCLLLTFGRRGWTAGSAHGTYNGGTLYVTTSVGSGRTGEGRGWRRATRNCCAPGTRRGCSRARWSAGCRTPPPPLAVVLFTRAEGGSYALAGALSAVYGRRQRRRPAAAGPGRGPLRTAAGDAARRGALRARHGAARGRRPRSAVGSPTPPC